MDEDEEQEEEEDDAYARSVFSILDEGLSTLNSHVPVETATSRIRLKLKASPRRSPPSTCTRERKRNLSSKVRPSLSSTFFRRLTRSRRLGNHPRRHLLCVVFLRTRTVQRCRTVEERSVVIWDGAGDVG